MLSVQETQALIAELLSLHGNLTRSTILYLKRTSDGALIFSNPGDLSDYLINLQREVTQHGQTPLHRLLKAFTVKPEDSTFQKNSKEKQQMVLEHLLYDDRFQLHGLCSIECGGPQCTHNSIESGKKLMACSACRCVRYCSKKCQKSHWKAGHKHVCDSIATATDGVEKDSLSKKETVTDAEVERFLKDQNISIEELMNSAPSLYSMFKK